MSVEQAVTWTDLYKAGKIISPDAYEAWFYILGSEDYKLDPPLYLQQLNNTWQGQMSEDAYNWLKSVITGQQQPFYKNPIILGLGIVIAIVVMGALSKRR